MPTVEPDWTTLAFHLPLSSDLTEVIGNRVCEFSYGKASQVTFTTFADHACANMPGNLNSTNQFGFFYTPASLAGVNTGNNNISISMWFNSKSDSTNGKWCTYLRYGHKINNEALNLGGRYGKKIYGGNESMDIGQSMGFNINDVNGQTGKWVHHVVTYNKDTGNIIVYRDTEIIGNEVITLNIVLDDVGLRIANTNRQCDSRYVHDIRIFNKCLSPAEVQWLYENHC